MRDSGTCICHNGLDVLKIILCVYTKGLPPEKSLAITKKWLHWVIWHKDGRFDQIGSGTAPANCCGAG